MGDDKQLETQRDIFVFQCMIGCRVSDLYKMTYANIIGDCIEYVPRKTRDDRVVTVSVPLIGAAKELIRKYLDENRGTLFPFISEQKYNVYITGSNAKMLSREIATTLGGRYWNADVYPYSFFEYLKAKNITLATNWMYGKQSAEVSKLFNDYFSFGGFPEFPD